MVFAYDPALRVDLAHELPAAIRAAKATREKPYTGYKLVKDQVVLRKPQDIIGFTLHQTAVQFSVSVQQVKAAKGDRRLALARRALKVPAHLVCFDGFFVTPCPLLAFAYHGHGLNAFTFGQEIDGLHEGVVGDASTVWGGKQAHVTLWTPSRRDAARAALFHAYEEGRRLGCPLAYYFGHRQSTAKPSDPGQHIWEDIGIDFAERELGLKPKLEYTLVDSKGRKGRPIPREWDPRSLVRY